MSLIRRSDPRRGAAAVEFALLVPLFILLFVGTAELVMHIRTWFRLERTVAEVANVGTQADALTPADVAGLFEAARAIAAPVTAWSNGTGVGRALTAIGVVSGTANGNVPNWTCFRGDLGLAGELQVAGKATLPNAFLVPSGQSVMVVEIVNTATPWAIMSAPGPVFFGTIGPGPVRTYAILRPRAAQLTSIGGACP
jgi:Flp pilus assembly protein TadG